MSTFGRPFAKAWPSDRGRLRAIGLAMGILGTLLPPLCDAQSPLVEPASSRRPPGDLRPAPADLVLINGNIYTEDPFRRVVRAVAVRDGKFVFSGTNAEAAGYIGPNTRVEDAGDRLILPGLIDIHMHPLGIVDFASCDLEAKPRTLAQIASFVHACLERQQVPPGHWLSVSQWEYAAGNQTDPRHPTLRAALDEASTRIPIVMSGWDGHHAAYNSAALALAKNAEGETVGYSKRTLAQEFAPYRAVVGVDSNGEPSGDIQDEGRAPIDSSAVAREKFERLLERPERLAEEINKAGLTAIQDAAAGLLKGYGSGYEVYDALIRRGTMTFRLNMAQFWKPEDFRQPNEHIDWDAIFAKADAVRHRYAATALARADAIKIFADGDLEANPNNVPPMLAPSPRFGRYLQPIFGKDADGNLTVKDYVDLDSPVCAYVRASPEQYSKREEIAEFMQTYGYHPAQCAISHGSPQHAPAVFNEYVRRAHLAGYTIHIHTSGEVAVHMAVDALEAARKADGISTQPDTLAHIQCATEEDIARIGRDRFVIAYTYSWMYAEPKGYDLSVIPFYDRVLGNSYEALHSRSNYFERCTYPTRTSKEAGAILGAGSDAPVLTRDPQPFVNMEMGVTRARHGLPPLSPWQRLDIREVLDSYTIDAARALNRSDEIGSIEPGKSADFIMVDQNILELADAGRAEKIGDTRVLKTWFMGKLVYAAAQQRNVAP